MHTARAGRMRHEGSNPVARWTMRAFAASALALAALVPALPGAPVASAAPSGPVGCGYGTGGPFADTLCWIDMSAYNDGLARGAGQPMSVNLPGGYTVAFTVHTSGTRGVVSSIFPTWDYGAAVGKYIYLGTPGQPALYQSTGFGAETTTITLSDIAVTDASATPVHGWRMVGVDAEATANSESITFSSNGPVSTLATFTPPGGQNGCQVNVQQVDANTITCTGSAIGDVYGTVLVGALEPSSFSQTMTVGNTVSREGVAFAFQSSTVAARAVVTGRAAATDSFNVIVMSPEEKAVGAASTGASDSASTGDLVVLPRIDGSGYLLMATGGPGTDLSRYQIAWACTRNGVADPTLVAPAASIAVSPQAGEAIACVATLSVAAAVPVAVTVAPRFTG